MASSSREQRRAKVMLEIFDELHRQDEKWGNQADKTQETWHLILAEEVGEVANALLEGKNWEETRKELLQVAAVAFTWVVYKDRAEYVNA